MKVCVLVDPYKFSRAFTAALRKIGIQCIYVQSSIEAVPVLACDINHKDYLASFYYDGDYAALLQQLQAYDVAAVIAVCEPGVELADRLSHDLHCKNSNDIALSSAKRNKYQMLTLLSKNNIPNSQYFTSDNVEEILQWVESSVSYPVVIKPLRGAATDGVKICSNKQELKKQSALLLAKNNLFNESNKEILVQEFLEGAEYTISTVSCAGKHYVCDIWQYHKVHTNNGSCVYERAQLVKPSDDIKKILVNYTQSVLDVLGIQYGPAQTELILTNAGPRLLETGARIMGWCDPENDDLCLGHNQVDLTVDAYFNPDKFMKKFACDYEIKNHFMVIALYSQHSGKIKNIPIIELAKKLKSYKKLELKYKVGGFIQETTDLTNIPGKLKLTHEDPNIIMDDYQVIANTRDKHFNTVY